MSGKAKWTDKTFALKKLDNFIKNYNFCKNEYFTKI